MDTELMLHAALDDLARGTAARARAVEARRPATTHGPAPASARTVGTAEQPAGAWRRLLQRLPARARGHAPA